MQIKKAACLVILAVLFAAPRQSRAQAEYVRPTEGVVLPAESVTETRDATSLSINPANLAFLDSWSFVYVGTWLQKQEHTAGQGHGFFFGFPLGPLSFGLGLESLLPTKDMEAWQGLDDRIRFSLGMALNFNRTLTFGAAYRTFWYYDLGDIDAFDLGVTIHPSNYIALSFTASDINSPKIHYYPVLNRLPENTPNRFNIGLTLRPFANDRLAFGGELNYLLSKDYSRTDASAMLSIMPINGLTLRGKFGSEGLGYNFQTAYLFSLAVEINLPSFGVGVGFHGQAGPGDYYGTTWMARFSGDKAPSIVLPRPLRPAQAVSIEITEPLDSYGLADLTLLFERILNDDSVDMILFKPEPGTISMSMAEELRGLFKGLKNADKSAYCYLQEATSAVYLACASADQVWINPAGGVRLSGISTTSYYYRSLFDKIGVEADIVRIGDYKSSPESYTRTEPSQPAEYQVDRYMDSVYERALSNLASDRNLSSVEAVKNIVEQGPFTPKEALKNGLVDRIVSADEIPEQLKQIAGPAFFLNDRYGHQKLRHRRYVDRPAVAVINISGTIVDGESINVPFLDLAFAGAKTLTETIRRVKKDPGIQAVVLRIDSPGGSAPASEILWREIMSLRKEKPVIVSMGSVAASGGYYLASAADEIYAESTTLTGSIGIFYGKVSVAGLLDKIGIDFKTYKRGAHADLDSLLRPYTPEERKHLMSQIKEYYDLFLQRVVEGRGRGFTPEIVDKLGRGRIWSGADAKQNLLVDEIGGFKDALNRARELGRVPQDVKVFVYPDNRPGLLSRMLTRAVSLVKQPSPLEQLVLPQGLKHTLRSLMPFAQLDPESPRAILPFVLEEK